MTTGSADDVMQRYRVPIVLAGVTVVAFILAMAFDASFSYQPCTSQSPGDRVDCVGVG